MNNEQLGSSLKKRPTSTRSLFGVVMTAVATACIIITLIPLFAAVSALLTIAVTGTADNHEKTKKIKALLITGGCCHDYPNQKLILPAGIDERSNIEIEWKVWSKRALSIGVEMETWGGASRIW